MSSKFGPELAEAAKVGSSVQQQVRPLRQLLLDQLRHRLKKTTKAHKDAEQQQ
jgi:hypothetical protein